MTISLQNKNFAWSTLATTISNSVPTLSVKPGDGIKFPSVPFMAVIWNDTLGSASDDPSREIIQVTNISTDTFTIIRGQEGTSSSAWTLGVKIAHTLTAGKIVELETEINSKISTTLASTTYFNKSTDVLLWNSVNKLGAVASDVGAETAGTTSTHAALTTNAHGGIVSTTDSRLSDQRSPLSHTQAESTLTFTDITNGNVSTAMHGFVPKVPNDSTKFLNGLGNFASAITNSTPSSATASGILGEIRFDTNYIYVCVATNTWKRSTIATW
jgi:hypothetical protein